MSPFIPLTNDFFFILTIILSVLGVNNNPWTSVKWILFLLGFILVFDFLINVL